MSRSPVWQAGVGPTKQDLNGIKLNFSFLTEHSRFIELAGQQRKLGMLLYQRYRQMGAHTVGREPQTMGRQMSDENTDIYSRDKQRSVGTAGKDRWTEWY